MSKRKLPPKPKEKSVGNAASRMGSPYDKIIKENFTKSLKTIVQDIGGIQIAKSQPMRTKMQHTKERDPDELSRITLVSGEEKILHSEAHLKDENDINWRMCEYYAMLKRMDDKTPIVQFIVYIGSEDPKFITGSFQTDVMTFNYNLIVLKDIPYQTFLEAENPETVVFSILADFQGEDPEKIGQKIADRLKKLAKSDSNKEKYFTQLRVLSNIRKLQPIIDKIMANIYKLIDISEDPLYVKGIKEGEDKGEAMGEAKLSKAKYQDTRSMIINTDFDDVKIAYILSVSEAYVAAIRKEISNLQ